MPVAPTRLLAMIVLALATAGCGPKGVRLETYRILPKDREPTLFVVAARHKPKVVASLRETGFRVVDSLLEAPYFLRVTVGTDKGYGKCGTLANVKYALRHQSVPVLELAAAGWLGDCVDNVFNGMSRRLMVIFRDGEAGEVGS